ncbi:hypothetical protein [Romboutsia sp.]|uniref:hypothetical protein n=1 Tax=Romboutsia sp. TaxID=1965302 RepID=UPI003F36C4DA
MLFREFKDKKSFKDIQEIEINKKINVRGREILILSLIKYNGVSRLWTLCKNTTDKNQIPYFEHNTNRETFIQHIVHNQYPVNIRNMVIQNKVINFESSQSTPLEYACAKDLHIIDYFIDNGSITEEWDNINIEDMIFTSYEQNEDEEFVNLDYNEKIEITFEITEEIIEKLIQHPINTRINIFEKDTKIHYQDYDKSENFFYLNEVEKYDVWKRTIEEIETNIENIDEEYRCMYKEDILNAIENICPKDMYYVNIYYENRENEQLRFLSKEYLDQKPDYGSSTSAIFWSCDNKKSINGYTQYTEGLQPVEKDFDGNLEIELFSKYTKIPKETISFIL